MSKTKILFLSTQYSVLITLFFVAGCGARRTPDLERIFAAARERKGKPPLIVVPGILGSQLVNRKTGEVVWPSAFRAAPDELELPMTPDLEANRDELAAKQILETAKLARLTPEVQVYAELLKALKTYGGYREGDWDNPTPGGDADTLYVFPYDWRRDNVETARALIRRIADLKRKLNRPDLRFNILGHSMGGLVARYAARYGDADLPPAGETPVVTWAGASGINKIFMFGTPNEGSAEAFATLLEGYSVQEGLRRRIRLLNKLSREDAMTLPSIYQLLPHGAATRFLDENLQPLKIDLYDPATWRKYGWTLINDPDYRARYARGAAGEEPGGAEDERKSAGDPALLDAYLAAVLERARRFHEALDLFLLGDAEPVPLYAFGGDCEETLFAPVIIRDEKKARWLTLTSPREIRAASNRRYSRKEVTHAMFEPGDGRVTRRSLLGTNLAARRASVLFDTPLPLAYAVFACDTHSSLHNNKTLQDNALTLLVNEVMKE